MSKEFCEKFHVEQVPLTTPELRQHCQRPGRKDENGNILYFTEQAHKDTCDVNKIIQKYDRHGVISHVSKFEAKFGDVTGIEFKECQDRVINAQRMFDELPSHLRKRFQNSPQKLLAFMDDVNNRDEAIKLGIIDPDWTEATDGIGEHVKLGENKKKSASGPLENPDET